MSYTPTKDHILIALGVITVAFALFV